MALFEVIPVGAKRGYDMTTGTDGDIMKAHYPRSKNTSMDMSKKGVKGKLKNRNK